MYQKQVDDYNKSKWVEIQKHVDDYKSKQNEATEKSRQNEVKTKTLKD